MNEPDRTGWTFPRRVLLVTVAVVMVLLLSQLSAVIILVFAGIVVATVLRGIARQFERWFKLPPRLSVALSALLVVAVFVVLSWVAGDALAAQFTALSERLPQAWSALIRWLEGKVLGRELLEVVRDAWDSGLSGSQLASAAGLTLGSLGTALLMFVLGGYLAAEPRLYVAGAVRLVPPSQRPQFESALAAAGKGLTRWLQGQAVSMLFLGVTTAVGLALLGMPLAAVLGLITGVFAFVPFFGAVTAGLLAVLLAFVEGPQMALGVVLLFIAIQQMEEYLVQPLVQRWAVKLPPVLGLTAAVIFGILFGPLGVMFATPLMVAVMILVQRLYVDGVLENAASNRT
jgi:predicted PurR-regulated permease PerM